MKRMSDWLRETRWTEVRVGDTVVAQVCPACSCLVAAWEGLEERHVEQHVVAMHSGETR